MYHLETLIAEYLESQGYLVRRNTKVGRLKHGGWQMELDIVAFHPQTQDLVHYEPSIDALSWEKREARHAKKFQAGKRYILKELFSWLSPATSIRQIAVFISHPRGRDSLAGGMIVSIDELMAEVRGKIVACGPMARNAISEQFPLLRTIQMALVGYYGIVEPGCAAKESEPSQLEKNRTDDLRVIPAKKPVSSLKKIKGLNLKVDLLAELLADRRRG
jgi:hypothetical protein